MTLAEDVARHYSTERLLGRIDAALQDAGVDPRRHGIDDLKPVDEFHTGGIEATTALLDPLELGPETVVIDLGCGLGGTARHIVHRYGAVVHGIDLTHAFVETGLALNDRLGLSDRIVLSVGDVTALPMPDGFADLVTMFHVGMNILDKQGLFAETARVLRPGGTFALFDVMRDQDPGDLLFPLPWAETVDLSHVASPNTYRRAARDAGLTKVRERERRQFTLDYFTRISKRIAAEGVPPLGIHLLMGDTAAEKLGNYVANVDARRIAPVEMIFRRPAG